MPKEFSSDLRKKLHNYAPQKSATAFDMIEHPGDRFVEDILNAAGNAAADMVWALSEVNKQGLIAEQKNALKAVQATTEKLRRLSQPLVNLLEVGADPMGVADQLEKLAGQLEATEIQLKGLTRVARPVEAHHKIALELAPRVLSVLEEYGLSIGATYDKDVTSPSDAVVVLKLVGDDIGLCLSEVTWRDIVAKSKQKNQVK